MKTPVKPSAWSLLPSEWKPLCKELGLPAFRADQIVTALYQNFAQSWQEITTLSTGFRVRETISHPRARPA